MLKVVVMLLSAARDVEHVAGPEVRVHCEGGRGGHGGGVLGQGVEQIGVAEAAAARAEAVRVARVPQGNGLAPSDDAEQIFEHVVVERRAVARPNVERRCVPPQWPKGVEQRRATLEA